MDSSKTNRVSISGKKMMSVLSDAENNMEQESDLMPMLSDPENRTPFTFDDIYLMN